MGVLTHTKPARAHKQGVVRRTPLLTMWWNGKGTKQLLIRLTGFYTP